MNYVTPEYLTEHGWKDMKTLNPSIAYSRPTYGYKPKGDSNNYLSSIYFSFCDGYMEFWTVHTNIPLPFIGEQNITIEQYEEIMQKLGI